MKRNALISLILVSATLSLTAKDSLTAQDPPPVIGLCIEAPASQYLDQFLSFMENDLAPGGVNTLVLRVDYGYEYTSHPELRSEGALTREQVKQLVSTARENHIRLIPHINLLGQQSWAGTLNKLLEVYPEFDEKSVRGNAGKV